MKSILQFSLLDSMDVESLLVYVRGRMEIMMDESKLKHPYKDFSEQEKIIDYLQKTQNFMHKIYEGNKFLIKEAIKADTTITALSNKIWKYQQEIEKQKQEIENLKQNITI